YLLKINKELKDFWSLKKAYYILVGILCGTVIAGFPVALALITGKLTLGEVQVKTSITLGSILVTLSIVSWEELWFRGMFLNYCNRYLSALTLSIAIGLLFMLMHLFNPQINLVQTGPTLFFAGALLTILYLHFNTIWLPIGVHFGNNLLNAILSSKLDNDLIFGNEG